MKLQLLKRVLVNLNHFRLLRVVGKGAFGKVRIVERKDTGLTFALKYIRKDEGVWQLSGEGENVESGIGLMRGKLQWFDRRVSGISSGSDGCWSI